MFDSLKRAVQLEKQAGGDPIPGGRWLNDPPRWARYTGLGGAIGAGVGAAAGQTKEDTTAGGLIGALAGRMAGHLTEQPYKDMATLDNHRMDLLDAKIPAWRKKLRAAHQGKINAVDDLLDAARKAYIKRGLGGAAAVAIPGLAAYLGARGNIQEATDD